MTKIIVDDFYNNSHNKIYCWEEPSGYFESEIEAISFIKKHNKENNSFFLLRAWIFNPSHRGQCNDYLYEECYNADGDLICKNPTYHFIVNFNELNGDKYIYFTGRDDVRLNKNDLAWFYDIRAHKLCKCKIGEIPWNTKKCKEFDQNLDWYDDSYLIYPLPIPEDNSDNHQHILSCYMFTDEYIQKLLTCSKENISDD